MPINDTTAKLLREYADRYETADFINGDPSYFMHQVQGAENQEAMAFVASVLSYGSRKQFMPKIQQLLDWSRGEMDRWLREGDFRLHFSKGDKNCFYRLYNCDCMFQFLDAYSQLLNRYNTLGEYVRQNASDGLGTIEAICRYFASSGVSTVVPKDTTSACKRVCMFARWMVRTGSPVDLGLWADFIDRRTLVMPLDTHVLSQSVRLGLLNATTASMNAARRLTEILSAVFPDDPLRGDFALFGYGVNHS
ncbi:MAG: TIGR02757 family protein [Bacteroidales bacterium]|nr:TIGR02757 family protein [Bacteroidales bacterium]